MSHAKLYAGVIDTNNVDVWLRSYANEIVDCFDELVDDGNHPLDVDFYECAHDVEFTVEANQGLTIIAAYGWNDALMGYNDTENSPWELFERDAHNMAISIIEDKYGITL